ncbi:MAG: alpha/beta hydrolase [Spirochaetia bacterium]|nr:alpha/beta hydrolase [Spirochaetia bacterium]
MSIDAPAASTGSSINKREGGMMSISLRTRFWRSAIRRVFKESGLSIPAERLRSNKNSRFHVPFPKNIGIEAFDIDGMPAVSIRPPEALERRVILHLHGGGYVTGSIAAYLMLCVPMSRAMGMRIVLPEYRLAPEHVFPAALDDGLKAFRWLRTQGYEASDIILSGDSAGGGLCLATVLALRDAGEALPGAVLCLSPWADLTNASDSHASNASTEILLKTEMLDLWARHYAGDDGLSNPLVSPVFADFKDFPALFIQVASGEVLLDDSLALQKAALLAGVDVELRIWDDLWHVWPVLGDLIPESRLAFNEMKRFLGERFKN